MTSIAYFGDRFDTFQKAMGTTEIITETRFLPPEFPADIVVIDRCPPDTATVPIGVIGVVSSDNREGLQVLMQSGVRTVTCGMSYRDTVTLSGTRSGLCVCLQRRLPAIGGRIIEPAEFPVDCTDIDPCCLLLAAAVRLLCGMEP